mmetsp:Transcript_41656/g.48582  ORF Transcript_41656/g.48582 Transcript_41656/m.48582 type:complete len:107 (-) Transcript_41656:408-728(-)
MKSTAPGIVSRKLFSSKRSNHAISPGVLSTKTEHHRQNTSSLTLGKDDIIYQIPPLPSWSLKELRIHANKIDDNVGTNVEETKHVIGTVLKRMSKRCLINIDHAEV